MLDVLIPDIEEDIPLPAKAVDAMPELSLKEELEMRSRTMKLLAEVSNIPLVPTEQEKFEALELVRQAEINPSLKPDFGKYSNSVMAYLEECIREHSAPLVENLADLKSYIVSKLVYEVEHSKSSKDRISALRNLGEIDGVDAFKKRSESMVRVLPIDEVEKKLFNFLDSIEYTVLDRPPPPLITELDADDEEIEAEIAEEDPDVV